MQNFWKNLKRASLNKPFSVLAPMDDVTDVVFREVILKLGRPDVFFTEFTNVEALMSKGKESQIQRLRFSKKEHPIVAQLWGINPENFYLSAKLVKKLMFDGIDLNMGCPDKTVRKNGACSALIDNREKAREIIEATLRGADGLPISIKTRLGKSGFDKSWIEFLLQFKISCLIIHLRTVRDMSKVPAKWELLKEIVELRNKINKDCLIIGNGDIDSLDLGIKLAKKYKADGFMIGRGIFKNPLIFSEKNLNDLSVDQRLKLLITHTKLFDKTWGHTKNFAIMKKFFKIYCSDFEGASELRAKLMNVKNIKEVRAVLNKYKQNKNKTTFFNESGI